jgi:hypothetical protein
LSGKIRSSGGDWHARVASKEAGLADILDQEKVVKMSTLSMLQQNDQRAILGNPRNAMGNPREIVDGAFVIGPNVDGRAGRIVLSMEADDPFDDFDDDDFDDDFDDEFDDDFEEDWDDDLPKDQEFPDKFDGDKK